jgi:hypothetical protein
MSNPYQTPTQHSSANDQSLSVLAILVGPFIGFPLGFALAAAFGLSLATLFHYTGIVHSKAAMLLVLAVAFPLFVFPPYILCGYVAGRLAKQRVTLHAFIAGLILLIVSSIPPPSNISGTYIIRYISAIGMSHLGGKLATRRRKALQSTPNAQAVSAG